jgi:organic hydroperoxide reductase OsmC/OhrA
MSEYNVKVKGKKFIYRSSIKWASNGEGVIESENKSPIRLSTPIEFGGKEGIWTPEELLVSSVNACLMTTFSYYAQKKGFEFVSYRSSAEGAIELVDMKYMFSKIIIRAKIEVKSREDVETAENLLKISKDGCFIANSVKAEVTVEPEVKSVS